MAEHHLISSLLRPFYRKGRDAEFRLPGALGNQSRLLCIDPGDLASVSFHMPLINAIHRQYPGCRMDFLVPESHAALVVPTGLAKNVLLYREGQLNPWRPAFASLLRKLGTGKYDMSILMSFEPRPRLELGVLASGAPLRVGPSHADSWPAVNCELRVEPGDEGYLGDRVVRLAPFLGLDKSRLDARWPLPAEKIRHVAQQVHFHKPNPDQMLIGFDLGIGKSGHAFALENLEFLVRQLASQLVCRVLPLGEPEQKERLDEFGARISQIPVGLARDTILDMVLLLTQCDLFLAGNTDFFHLAVAQGVPCIGLFSAKDAPHWVPRGRDHVRVLRLAQGEKVDVDTLMDAVEHVTRGRAATASRVIAEPVQGEDGEAGEPSPPEAPPPTAPPGS